MNPKVKEALSAAKDTKALLIGPGALAQAAAMFGKQFPGKKAVVIADETTFSVAGKQLADILARDGLSQDNPFIFTESDLHAEYRHVETLQCLLGNTDAIPVAVGSGTINDLVKLSSHLTGRSYMIAGTAASMDGYTSFGASITADGAKQTFECPAPRAVLADIDIIASAPAEMTAAGYADLFSKVTAGADWIIADALGVEPVEPKAWSIVQDGLADALGDPDGVRKGDHGALTKLVEGLMLGGFAMQWAQSSRPASGAEHYMSHLWDMGHHKHNGKYVSHGFQVSIGTLAVFAFYEQLMKNDLSLLDTEYCMAKWISLADVEKIVHETFGETPFSERILSESKAKYVGREELGNQLEILKKNWESTKARLEKQLMPFAEAKARLAAAGAPTEPEHIGVSREHLRRTMIDAPMIRNRFTALDLAQRARLTDACLGGMFGQGGRWEIRKNL